MVNKKLTVKKEKSLPVRARWGVRVYYDAETEAYLRDQAHKLGFGNLQEYLKFKARRERIAAELLKNEVM